MTRKAVFLDRDGVLNRALVRDGKPYSPMALDEFELIPGVANACQQLAQLATLIVVTNQPEVARGRLSIESLDQMHQLLRQLLPVTDILYCPHDRGDGCSCRKPQSGMLLEGARRHGLDPIGSVMVGDRWSDVAAGSGAGCRTILIGDGYSDNSTAEVPDRCADDLAGALPQIADLLGLD